MAYRATLGGTTWTFETLADLMAKASPPRSGDALAGIAAASAQHNVAAKMALADVPLKTFLTEALIPYETDEVTRLILDGHDAAAFAPVASLTVGEFRDWLLSELATPAALARLAPGLTPEMAAAVSKLMRNQDLILAAKKCKVTTRFATPSACPGPWPCACSPTIRPTIRPASPPRSWTGCCTAAATR
jgi:ethanolamine ammonia-lyase large subunit